MRCRIFRGALFAGALVAVLVAASPAPAGPRTTYKEGDLFYGFAWGRAALVEQLTGKSYADNKIKAKRLVYNDDYLTAFANGPVVKKDFKDLNHAFADFLRGHDKWKEVLVDDGAGDDLEKDYGSLDDVTNNRLWRRKSKAGVAFAVQDKRQVHFAISYTLQAHMEDVPTKSDEVTFKNLKPIADRLKRLGKPSVGYQYKDELDAATKERIVTHSELRSVYRSWLKQKAYRTYITFWYEVPKGDFYDNEKKKQGKKFKWTKKFFAEMEKAAQDDDVQTVYLHGDAPWVHPGWKDAWDDYKKFKVDKD